MAQIIVMDGPGVGTTFELSPKNIIGCGAKCNIRLESDGIKNEQATIRRKNNNYIIAVQTPGDVLVNGQPVRQERKLIHGDMITLANIMLLYGEESAEKEPASAPPIGAHPTPTTPAVDSAPQDSGKMPTIKSRQRFFKNTDAALQSMHTSKNATRNMEVLLKVSNAIMSKLDIRDLLQQLLNIIFDELPADRGTIFLRDQKANKLWPMASKTRKEIKPEKLMGSRTIIKQVLDTKEGVLTRDAMEDARFQMALSIAAQEMHAALCVPLVGKNEEVLGIIHIDTLRSDRVFTEDHLKLVAAIAMQASLSIENALLVQQLGEKKRIEQELTIASNIQKQLLPKSLPSVEGVEVYGLMIPAKEVGGDYYDFVVSEDGQQLYICIGDVSGKGVPAGLVMVMARCFFRPLILSCANTKLILEELNKFLVEDTRKDMFMSMLVIKWDTTTQGFTWTGAGHEHLIIYRAQSKTCEAVRAGGIVLGMMKKAEKFFKEQVLDLTPGDALILYTDGVTETTNAQGEMVELERLQNLVEKYAHLNAEKICLSILGELKRFMGNAPQYDDITLVAIKKQ